MKKQWIYAALAVIGASLTWYHNIQFALENETMDMLKFINDCFVNHASSSITWDVSIAAATFLTWSNIECKRLRMRVWPLIFVVTFGVALAFSFPLFLWLRERHLMRLNAESNSAL